jgi:streptogramin lyase
VTTEGAVSELALPSPGSNPDGIAAGPGKSIWVTETGSDAIVEISLR